MLDIDKIFDDFDDFLDSYDEKALDAWLAFDRERDLIAKLLDGQTVPILIDAKPLPAPFVKNNSGYSEIFSDNNSYLLAA